MPIQQLAPDVAAKIAAGEVVERPASVVKELIENSIDAGATQIRVDLTNGGLQLIRITDNGCGIPAAELPLALARHATSKVAKIDDLEHIRSLGFRGEALASIAAVADVTLLSRPRGTEQGAQISANNGQISDVTTAASAEGTTITVRNLFSAVPARLKFLKSRNTEVGHCHHLLEQYALAYPEIRFSVFSDGRQIFATPGDGKLASVLVEVYGLQIADQMVPTKEHPPLPPEESDRPVVTGYVSRPSCYKSTRQHISFFVNRRWVMSRMLTAAVEGAYHSLLLTGRHPIAVINIQIDPTLLDVNVHPAKTEIRFLKERRVFGAILRAVREALLEEPAMPQWQPTSGSNTTNTSPSTSPSTSDDDLLDLDEDLSTSETSESAPDHPDSEARQQQAQNGHHERRSASRSTIPGDNPWLTVTEEETGTRPPLTGRLWQSHIYAPTPAPFPPKNSRSPSASGPVQSAALSPETIEAEPETDILIQNHLSSEETLTDGQATSNTGTHARRDDSWLPPSSSRTPANGPTSAVPAAVGQSVDPHQARRLPRLRVVGQVAQSYIVTEGEEGSMYLIDQHAAHERILLERMVAALKAREPISQLLLNPLRLDLAPTEFEAVEEHREQLEHIGFSFDFGEDCSLSVRAVPGTLVKQMSARSLHELLVDLTAEESLGHTETWEERALANVACKAAIKANYFLTQSEMREMIEQLEQTRAPYSCCHGRPTMVHFTPSALAHAFERR